MQRLRARVAIWWTDRHPEALTAAATLWRASGRYERAALYAEQAFERLRLGHTELDSEAEKVLMIEAATTGALACAGLRNQAKDETGKALLAAAVVHWAEKLGELSLAALLGDVLDSPTLRDLRPALQVVADRAIARAATAEAARRSADA
ncbi:MAG TPA: hypothetical protein VM241_05355 [Candidatus Thermoplasmatota archaeon]|nr:hypothetical protein [Candidatus Thermoplasmatota archaeon]